MSRTIVDIPLNRVEGDLQIRAEIQGGVVTDAWSSGTLYRGFENILRGRGARDGLVITPRICGICTTAHLLAAARALESVAGIEPTPTGVRVRNIALMAEAAESDLRQAFLMFTPDFAGPAHAGEPLHDEAQRRYRPFVGETAVEVIRATKRLLEIVAILGGQWPHSSFMVPGGVVYPPSPVDILRCQQILASFRELYERRVLGCSVERWSAVRSAGDLDAWLDERDEHRGGDLGFFLRFARAVGLDRVGLGHGNFLSVGALAIPEGSSLRAPDGGPTLFPAGFVRLSSGQVAPFEQARVAEHVSRSWYAGDEGGVHPFEGETRPYASGHEGVKYSWAKAPRYDGAPAETGPLAAAIIGGDALFSDLARRAGPSAMVRELARIARPARLLPAMKVWLEELARNPGQPCLGNVRIPDGRGVGLTQASRGALGHWIEIAAGKIARYQIITPTAWNGSPRDTAGVRGPWEEALVGTPVPNVAEPVMLGYVVRSFDPCLVCTVHAFDARGAASRAMLGQ